MPTQNRSRARHHASLFLDGIASIFDFTGSLRPYSIIQINTDVASLEADSKWVLRGQCFGLITSLAVLVLAGYMAYLGATAIAVAIVAIDVIGLVAMFVYRSLSRLDSRECQLGDSND